MEILMIFGGFGWRKTKPILWKGKRIWNYDPFDYAQDKFINYYL